MKEKIKLLRKRVLDFILDYWWIWLGLAIIGYWFTDFAIFRYIIYIIAIPFALIIFLPFIIQVFSPAFILSSSLIEHFRESKDMSFGKKYIFVPMALVSSISFATAQMILSTWVFILSFLIWMSVIGFFFTFLLMILFGLAPLAIFTAPFVIWFYNGFGEFIGIVIFLLLVIFWYGFSKLAFSENYFNETPEYFLGYSPQIFLLGALSVQIIALPIYKLDLLLKTQTLTIIGNWISLIGGVLLLLLALISSFIWMKEKKKLSVEEKESMYKPSIWIYILGFLFTSLLYNEFIYTYNVPAITLYWLNLFFAVALIARFVSFIKRKIKQTAEKNRERKQKKKLQSAKTEKSC